VFVGPPPLSAFFVLHAVIPVAPATRTTAVATESMRVRIELPPI
jgi:hypothetical protein